MIHVPGDLFSVNLTARGVPGLFARNERAWSVRHRGGPFGRCWCATIVGSMATTWHGVVNPPRRRCRNGATTTRR